MGIKAARLTIAKRSDFDGHASQAPDLYADVFFDWQCWNPNGYAQFRHYGFSGTKIRSIQSIIAEGEMDESRLKGLGFDIWALLPEDIQDSLEKFEMFAEKYDISESKLPFIINTDILTIPWDLCITKRKGRSPEKCKAWQERYDIAFEIYGVSDQKPISRTEEKNRVAIILKPFEEIDEEKMLRQFNEEKFTEENNNLLELINDIRRTENIRIDYHGSPKDLTAFQEIEDTLSEPKYDLVLYLGCYRHNEGLVIGNPATRRPQYFSIKKIGIGTTKSKMGQAIFLDACCTSIQKVVPFRKYPRLDSKNPEILIGKGANAFIGTIQEVQPTAAVVFARYFLESLFLRDSSLARAMFDARRNTRNYFDPKNADAKIPDEKYMTQSACFSLYGQNADALFNSFRRKRQEVKLIFPAVAEQYFKGFSNYIYPSSIPGVVVDRKENMSEVVTALESTNDPFIADLSILDAANLIAKYKHDQDKELVIIGGLFRLRPGSEDCALYFMGDLKKSDCTRLFCTDPLSSVTAMAMAYILSLGTDVFRRFAHKGGARRETYENIYLNALDLVEEKNPQFEPFLLAAKYKKDFEKELDKKAEIKLQLSTVSLYEKFLEVIEKEFPEYRIRIQNLPGEVLVTRKANLEKDKRMYQEIFDRWAQWELGASKNTKDVSERFSSSQDIIYSFSEDDMETVIGFSDFVFEKLKGSPSWIPKPLKEENFVLIRPKISVGEEETVDDNLSAKKKSVEPIKKAATWEKMLDEKLHARYTSVVIDQDLTDLLDSIEHIFPNFTGHGPEHSQGVIKKLESITENRWNDLTQLEILLLLCSAWLHDIGMADIDFQLKNASLDEKNQLRNEFRDKHGERSAEYIRRRDNWNRLIKDQALANLIAIICEAHQSKYDISKIPDLVPPPNGYEQYKSIRLRKLAALLRLADACDISYKRSEYILTQLYNVPETSIAHHKGNWEISNVVPEGRTIVLSAMFKDEQGAANVQQLKVHLEQELKGVKAILKDKKNDLEIDFEDVQVVPFGPIHKAD